MESTSETAANAGSTKVAAYVGTAEPAAHMSAATKAATVSTPTSPAARKRVSGTRHFADSGRAAHVG
jgi:hypothetical protein